MKINELKINHIENPLGYDFSTVIATFVAVDDTYSALSQELARIEVASDDMFKSCIFDSGWSPEISSTGFELSLSLSPRTRYFWRVSVEANNGDIATSDVAWFETGKMDEAWQAKWITSHDAGMLSSLLRKNFDLEDKPITEARLYVSGVGLYELYLNTEKVGTEYLTPGCTVYDTWIQYQTYDVTNALQQGHNELDVCLGNGWYKGRFGFNHGGMENHYGQTNEMICELVVTYQDGSHTIIGSDQTWQSSRSRVQKNGIYDGEHIDARIPYDFHSALLTEQSLHSRLAPRLGLPIIIHDRIAPVNMIYLENGDVILDFGANIVGWIEFDSHLKQGESITLHYSEVMQEGDIYTENLRTAEATFSYISNGEDSHVRPHFTYFGFRYVKLIGNVDSISDIEACFVYSKIDQISYLKTGLPIVNRFIDNVLRSHKDNFLDIPTDCPQRDERMGWTGDLQVFSSPACMNMDVYAFLVKYLKDLAIEQKKLNGAVPFVVPMFDVKEGGSCAWGDAATVVPWNMWLHYGDKSVLKRQYTSMKNWVNYIYHEVSKQTSNHILWDSGFHFGDWLALDNEPHIKTFKGKTEDKFVASIYYYYSALIVGKTAKILGFLEDSERFLNIAEQVINELRNEYITHNGKLALDTQTAYILAILFDVYPQESLPRAAKDLYAKLSRDQFKITSGFVGTPYFCRALMKVGLNDVAYRMFLSEEKPSWLYAVKQGATTIWERWDSMDEQGKMNPDNSMNSLNHYAFGSVIDWLYKDVCGLTPSEISPGFKLAFLSPKPNYRLRHVDLVSRTSAGIYRVYWEVEQTTGDLLFELEIPFDARAHVVLPDISDFAEINYHGRHPKTIEQSNDDLVMILESGKYSLSYKPNKEYIPRYNIDMPLRELLNNDKTKSVLNKFVPGLISLPFISMVENETLIELSEKPFFNYDNDVLNDIEKEISCHVVC